MEIVALLQGLDPKVLKAPLGQKIAAVRKIEPNPRYSKKRRDMVHEALDALSPLLERRAEIAHSALQIVRIRGAGVDLAGFSNPATQLEHGTRMVLYDEEDLVRLACVVRAIARKLAA